MLIEKEITDRVKQLVEPILQEESLDLVDIEFKPSGKRWSLRLFIDKEGGVTIGDCERVNRELGRILDVEDFIEKSYVLEVSSPGLTRSLKRKEDFERYRGRDARIITTTLIEGKNEFSGKIVAVTDETVEIEGETDKYGVPLCAIKKANLEFRL